MPSSVIAYAQYDPEGRFLDIRYRSGHTYRYLDVPAREYEAYRASYSKGEFLNAVIKKKYRFEQLN